MTKFDYPMSFFACCLFVPVVAGTSHSITPEISHVFSASSFPERFAKQCFGKSLHSTKYHRLGAAQGGLRGLPAFPHTEKALVGQITAQEGCLIQTCIVYTILPYGLEERPARAIFVAR